MTSNLLTNIHNHYHSDNLDAEAARLDFANFLDQLEAGILRAAEKVNGRWTANPEVKEGILLGFRLGKLTDFSSQTLSFSELDTYPPQKFDCQQRSIRIVPGGNSIRRGAYIADDVIMMPPAFVNVGAYVGKATLIDSHALVGSCAQIGERVHISAGVQIGGVLEPIGQTPVVIEDGCLIGGNCGLYEGVCVETNAVIAAGTVLTASTPLYDLVNDTVYRATPEQPLTVPANAVVVAGSRPAKGDFATKNQLHIPAAIIIKFRDASTDSKTLLEDLLR